MSAIPAEFLQTKYLARLPAFRIEELHKLRRALRRGLQKESAFFFFALRYQPRLP